jgi:two-component system, LytTR family, response regulator
VSAVPTPIRVVIADDEPPARRRIRALLDVEDDVEVVGESSSGRATVSAVRELRPDLLFLDVQMPDGDGFDVLAALAADQLPNVVFVTAYDAYALRAFDVHAVDYLLKPFEVERFRVALDRVRAVVRGRPDPALDQRLLALIGELRPPAPRAYPERIPVKSAGRIRLVSVDEIDYVEAETNYVRLHAGARSYLLRGTLSAVEAKLDPARFVRIHRSTIVRIDRVQEVEPLFQGEYVIVLRSGVKLTSARRYRDKLRSALNLTL